MSLKSCFKNILSKRHLTQRDVSDVLGISQSYLTLIVNKMRIFPDGLLDKLHKILNLTDEELNELELNINNNSDINYKNKGTKESKKKKLMKKIKIKIGELNFNLKIESSMSEINKIFNDLKILVNKLYKI